jgi:hypothetical protein
MHPFAHGLYRLWGDGRRGLYGLDGWEPDTGLDGTTMEQYLVLALDALPIMVPVLLVFLLLPLGLIVLAVGTARAGILPGWLAWLMPVGMFGVAASIQYPVLLTISALALLATFGLVGVRVLRGTSGALSKAAPV